jgi:flavin reductase (DIM6/NTAB) family NADH-FMN oxidoreductase RutF
MLIMSIKLTNTINKACNTASRSEIEPLGVTVAVASPRLGPDVLREIMASLAAGVSVVTTVGSDGQPCGLTTTAVTSVSAAPPLLLVCISRESRTLPAIRHSGRFAVNLVHAEARETALCFASKLEDKFSGRAWRYGRLGTPLLDEDVLAWAECRVEQEIEAGDHVVFIGGVEHGAAHGGERAPLTYFRRRFGTWAWSAAEETHPRREVA